MWFGEQLHERGESARTIGPYFITITDGRVIPNGAMEKIQREIAISASRILREIYWLSAMKLCYFGFSPTAGEARMARTGAAGRGTGGDKPTPSVGIFGFLLNGFNEVGFFFSFRVLTGKNWNGLFLGLNLVRFSVYLRWKLELIFSFRKLN